MIDITKEQLEPTPGYLEQGPDYLAAFIGRGVADRALWLEARRTVIGGSDAAAAIGKSRFKTPRQLYYEKRGEIAADDLSANQKVKAGLVLEEVVARWYCEETGRRVRKLSTLNRIVRHPSIPFMACNVDRVVIGEKIGLECKTTDKSHADEWGETWTDKIPQEALIQCQHNMEVMDLPEFHVPVLIGGNDFRIYRVRRDDRLLEVLRQREADFWHMVTHDIVPPPVTLEDAKLRWPNAQAGSSKQVNGEVRAKLWELAQADVTYKALEKTINLLKRDIIEFAGEAEVLLQETAVLATYKKVERAGYTVAPTSYRQLLNKCKVKETT